MKTIILASIATLMMSFTGVNAQNNVESTGVAQNRQDNSKECIFVDAQTKAPIKKSTYIFDDNGLRTSMVVYKWTEKIGWKENMRYTYNYNGSTLLSIEYSEWSEKKQAWHNTQQMQYVDNSQFLANNTSTKSQYSK